MAKNHSVPDVLKSLKRVTVRKLNPYTHKQEEKIDPALCGNGTWGMIDFLIGQGVRLQFVDYIY